MRPFHACDPRDVRTAVLHAVRFRRLPPVAEQEVQAALDQVRPESQTLLIQAAEDAAIPAVTALERLCCSWVLAASVNLADDLADGDCDYLTPRAAPGVQFLLQALAGVFSARSDLSNRCWEDVSSRLVRAASGQSVEVRGDLHAAGPYLTVAELIAGEQYAAYFGLIWEGSELAPRAAAIGSRLGAVGLVLTDILSRDRRLFGLPVEEQRRVHDYCLERIGLLDREGLSSVGTFVTLARPAFDRCRASFV